ncbi:MAG: hypothetical protein DYG98_27345 [Haliscomenobacteraceae bacterium CHB4]|nr:hypothetical protein [Haliscomenobacteraceae bacterium CHB4]
MQKLLFLFLLFPLMTGAQPRVTQSQVFKWEEAMDVNGITSDATSGNIFLLYQDFSLVNKMSPSGPKERYKWAVDVFSPDLKPLHRNKPQQLDMPGGDEVPIGHAVSFEGKPHLVFLLHKKKENKTEVYRAALQPDGVIGKPELAGALDGKWVEESQIMYARSADNALFLVAKHPSRDKPKEPFSYIVFDQKGNIRRKGNLQIPPEPSDLAVGYPMVANDGAIWAPVWADDKGLRQEVWVWSEGGNQPVKTDISPSDGKIATDLVLRQSVHDGFVYAGGTFAAASDGAEKGMFKSKRWHNDPNPEQGTFSLKLDSKSGKVVSRSVHTFSAATLSFWDKKPDALKKGDGLNSIRALDVLPMADGSVWVGVEQFFQIFQEGTINYTPQAIGSITDGRNFGDPCCESGVLAHHSSAGELLQEQVLGKRSWAINDNGLGYFFRTNAQGDLVALYTDHEANPGKNIVKAGQLERTLVGGYGNLRENACGAMMTMKKGEKSTTKKLFTQDETGTWFEPRLCVQVSDGAFLFVSAGRGFSYHLLKLEL